MIRVIIADEHSVFREGLKHILKRAKDIDCVGVAEDGIEALRLAKELRPDIVILDISLPKLEGTKAAKQIKSACPGTRILLLTHCYQPHCIESSILAGVDGYLLKNAPHNQLINAIRMVCAGEGVFNLEIVRGMMGILTTHMDKDKFNKLHSRELEVLKLVATGMSNKDIADELCISTHTVGVHLVHVFRKLEVGSRTEAVTYAIRNGLVNLNDLTSSDQS